jgi:UDP-N-acetylmuramate--alanine ligase
MGIGGVGMAGVAFLLKTAGHAVTGCDGHISPRTRWLETCGIPVADGHSPDHLDCTDELVVTPAVPRSAPELAHALSPEKNMRVRYRG